MDLNWLSPLAEAHPVGDHGWGSFARETIPAGTTVAAFGGYVASRSTLESLPVDRQNRSIQVDSDLFLVSGEDPEPGDLLNHSCAPSCGLVGAMVVVTLRDLEVGEELTFDYAMCDGTDYDEFVCACGSSICRGIVTGRDWQQPELQERYAGWFSPYLARRIAAQPAR